jgi:hypothetical protein
VPNTFDSFREFAGLAAIAGFVVWTQWQARRRLRPWYLIAWGGLAAISLPITLYFYTAGRNGEFTGWGGLVVIIVGLPALFIAAVSIIALLTLALLIPRYGFDQRPAEVRRAERKAERERWRSPEAQQERAKKQLKVYAVLIVLAVLYLKLMPLLAR